MKKSECQEGLTVYAQHPRDKQFYPAQIRCMATEDVHLNWGQQARDAHAWCPPSVGYHELRPCLMPGAAMGESDGQAPATTEQPGAIPPPEPAPDAGSVELDWMARESNLDTLEVPVGWKLQWRQLNRISNRRAWLCQQWEQTEREMTALKRGLCRMVDTHCGRSFSGLEKVDEPPAPESP
jgi:hypothetical protein